MRAFFYFTFLMTFLISRSQSFEINGLSSNRDTINMTDVNGKKQGIWVVRGLHQLKSGFSPQQTIEEGTYKDNKKIGIWIQYYKTGKIKNKIAFVDGRPNGPSILYYENGTLKEEGTWVNNRWIGKYKSTNEAGDLTEIIFDDKGKELEKKITPAKNSVPSKKK